MANPEHVVKFQDGVEAWNEWREQNPYLQPDLNGMNLNGANLSRVNLSRTSLMLADLSGADLSHANLSMANLSVTKLPKANLRIADLSQAYLIMANLSGADLSEANLSGADLNSANLSEANLRRTNLSNTKLQMANLRSADLTDASLEMASLVRSHCENAVFSNCHIYGMSAWEVNLTGAVQSNLVITLEDQPSIQVDNLQVAQFIHLLLNNKNVREVIDVVTTKVVLILGRFTEDRKPLLEAIRDALRSHGRLPILFDFDKPPSQTTDETISTLAHMSRFVIADLTDAKSVLQEMRSIVPNSPSVLVQPLLLESQEEPGMWDYFRKFPWVLEPVRYADQDALIAALDEKVIAPAEARALSVKS